MFAYNIQTTAVHTPVFDGPMELLLYLVRREGVDIREVSVAPIADAFLAQIDLMSALDLDGAADFLVMASTLCFLKSRELLPNVSPLDTAADEEARQLREALARRLMEYVRYREAAEALAERPWLDRDVFSPLPEPVRGNERAIEPGVDALGLLEVFYQVLKRRDTPPPVHEVRRDSRSLRDFADWVLAQLDIDTGGPTELADLLFALDNQADRVLAFLTVLELAKIGILDLNQEAHLGPVVIGLRQEADRGVLVSLSAT